MSSLIRNIQRKRLRQGTSTTDAEGNTVKVEHEPQPQRTIDLKDGGYATVRYTRGPLRVSAARLRAQGRLAAIQQASAMRDQGREFSRMVASAQKAEENRTRIDALLAAPVAVLTRQMRRHALRKGLPVPTTVAEAAKKVARARKPKTARVDGVAMTADDAAVAAAAAKPARKPRAKKAASAQQTAA